MKVSVVSAQTAPIHMNYDKNIEKIIDFVKRIMEQQPKTQLIVFPELSTTGCEGTKMEFNQLAEYYKRGRSFAEIGAIAKEFGIYIVYGYAERDPNLCDVLYNAMALIGPDGEAVGNYRKVHPFGGEVLWMRPGYEYPVFDTKIGKIGLMNCWDTAFPEVARIYALKGAELLCTSANWESPYDYDWDLVTKARCMDNILPLVASNRVGKDITLDFFGHSCIVSPLGRVMEQLIEPVEGFVYGELDLDEINLNRASYYTYFADRKPQTYEEIVKLYSIGT